jgi:phosphoserine aminotransferase
MICVGIRVSLYNAITESETDQLVDFIRAFIQTEASAKED